MKVLIIEPNWLGDTLFTTPAIKAIKENNKDSSLSVLVHSRCLSMLKSNPNIDEIITLDKMRGIKGFFKKIGLIPQLKSKKFDAVFLFSRSMSHALICALSGIPQRIGYKTVKRAFLLTKKINPPKKEPHRVEYYMNLVRQSGIDSNNKDYELFLSKQDVQEAEQILKEAGIGEGEPYFVINPGGNWAPKRWSKNEFGKLADELYKKYNTKVVITGAGKDIKLGEDIKKLCNSKPIILCGKTALKELAAVLKGAKAVISNDSGPMHIAVSQKAPTVALFGPTDPAITGPYGSGNYTVVQKEIDCVVPCYVKNCKAYKCMEAITVADAVEAVEKLLEKGSLK